MALNNSNRNMHAYNMHNSGWLSLVLTAILNMRFDQSFAVIGLVCSSFVGINAGTHKRRLSSPLGDQSRPHVRLGNCLASRTLVSIDQ